MEIPPTPGDSPVNNPQVGKPVNPPVPAVQAPAAQATPPATQNQPQTPSLSQPPTTPLTQPQSPVNAVTSEPKKSKFKLFLIISVVLILLIWGAVAFIYFQNRGI